MNRWSSENPLPGGARNDSGRATTAVVQRQRSRSAGVGSSGAVEVDGGEAVFGAKASVEFGLTLASEEMQGLTISRQLDGTADVADVLFGVIDSELVINRGDEILNFHGIVLHEHAILVRSAPNAPALDAASRNSQ